MKYFYGFIVVVLTVILVTPALAKSDHDKGNKGKEERWEATDSDDRRNSQYEVGYEGSERGDAELNVEERAQKRLEKQQRKLEKQQRKNEYQHREQAGDIDGDMERRQDKTLEKLTGMEKQRERKAQQVQKELEQGSEQGQQARQKRKKWYQFWD